jgi:hypothetical protein
LTLAGLFGKEQFYVHIIQRPDCTNYAANSMAYIGHDFFHIINANFGWIGNAIH